jgi:hypothetical protein
MFLENLFPRKTGDKKGWLVIEMLKYAYSKKKNAGKGTLVMESGGTITL